MYFIEIFLLVLLLLWNIFLSVDANAMLKPTHRGMMWTRGNYNSAGYNYMGINCGGIGRFKKNNGKCGVCGDAYNGPRRHETGGKYATGAIADVIDRGQRNIHVKILLNSDQGGYFEFKLCVPNGTAETEACFDKHLLKISEGRLQGDEYSYYVDRAGIIPLTVEIPDRVYCDRCVLQWKYVTGNTFGRDEHGVGCLGCGHQETFINCADVMIHGWEIPSTPQPPTTPIPTTMAWTTMMWTTSTVAPTTTTSTTTTPAPTTRAPSTTASRLNQITKARVTKHTQPAPRYSTKQRRPVTDFDEGSRRRSGYDRHPNAYSPVPAPAPKAPAPKAPAPQAPAIVPASVFRTNSVNIAQNQLKATVKPPSVVVKVPDKVKNLNVDTLPKEKRNKQPSNRTKKQSGPFKIPRPPRLSNEQIDALNSNNNIVPHHDPLQKYVKVGSSRIIAAVDYTTLRTQQVQTPPTIYKGDNFKQRSTASPVNIHAKNIPLRNQNTKSVDMFSSFGNEMMGTPSKRPTSRKETFGMNLMNEYSVIPDNSPKVSQQRQTKGQNRNKHSNSGSLLNEFAVGNMNIDSTRNILQNHGFTTTPTKRPSGNPYFAMDMYNSLTSVQTKRPQLQTRSYSTNSKSQLQDNNMFLTPSGKRLDPQQSKSYSTGSSRSSVHGRRQLPLNALNYNGKPQTYFPAQPGGEFASETGLFGGSFSHNSFGHNIANQNSVNTVPVSRYGQVKNNDHSNTDYLNMNQVSGAHVKTNLNTYNQNNYQDQHHVYTETRAVPTRTTKLPVTDTSTHRLKNSQQKDIAPWRNVALKPSSNLNGADLQGTPVNLFKNQERNSFKAPIVLERFTNYHIGGTRKKPNTLPEDLIKANQFRQQENALFTNTAKISNDSFHLNTDIHSPQNFFGQDHYIARDVELSNPAFGGPNTQDVQSQLALNVGQHETPHAQGGSLSFNDVHLNAGLHSPNNYFPQGIAEVGQNMPKDRGMNIPQQQNIGIHSDRNIEKLFIKPRAAKLPTTSTQAPTTSVWITTKPTTAPTTNVIDYQMQELKKLREKMERLQKMIEMRRGGYTSKMSTVYSPTQSFKDIHYQPEKAASQATLNTKPRNINSNINNDLQHSVQNTDFQQNNFYNARSDNNKMNVRKPSTVSPGMTKETTKYINDFKTQMLQSIKQANARNNQQLSPTSTSSLHNNKNDIYNISPYNNEKASYVTPSLRSDVKKPKPDTLVSQSKPQIQREQNLQKVQTSSAIVSMRAKQDQDRRAKYRRILQLLVERRKQKELHAKQEQQSISNAEQQHTSQQYKTVKQQNNQHVGTLQQSQQQEHDSHNYKRQNIYQQSLQQKPVMAEIKTQSIKKERIVQNQQTTSIRPIETIQRPNTAVSTTNVQKPYQSVDSSSYKPNAVKTTIDKLADRLAAGMAEKLASGGTKGVPNFHVLPLSSDSVMSALRNIAASVLKNQNIKNHLPQSLNSKPNADRNSSVKPKDQPFEKPPLREIHAANGLKKAKIINKNFLSTEVNKNSPVTTTAKQTTTALEQRRVQGGRESIKSADRLRRRQELIRKMKEMMLRRRQKLKMNLKTRTHNKPTYIPQVKPSHSEQHDMVGNTNLPSHSNTLGRYIDQPDNVGKINNYNDQTTTTNNNLSPTSYHRLKQTSQHATDTSIPEIPASASSKMIYSDSNQTVNNKARLRLSPDIARSMISGVRSMLARRKSRTGSKDVQNMSTKDVLVMPLNKEMLYKLLQSMKKRNVKAGR